MKNDLGMVLRKVCLLAALLSMVGCGGNKMFDWLGKAPAPATSQEGAAGAASYLNLRDMHRVGLLMLVVGALGLIFNNMLPASLNIGKTFGGVALLGGGLVLLAWFLPQMIFPPWAWGLLIGPAVAFAGWETYQWYQARKRKHVSETVT